LGRAPSPPDARCFRQLGRLAEPPGIPVSVEAKNVVEVYHAEPGDPGH
jgi:hypothetical protein